MNTKKAARAAAAGLVATGIFLGTLLIFGAAVFFGLGFSTGADTDVWRVLTLVVVFTLIAAGGALPARALGAGWRLSLILSAVTTGSLALATPPLVANAEGLFVLFYLFAFVAPAFITIAASVGNGLSFAGLASIAVVAALFFLVARLTGFFLLPGVSEVSAALLQGTMMVAVGWALLPALAALFQRPPDEAE